MKRGLYLLLLLFTLSNTESKASHAVGADLTYDCLGGNLYRFRLKFYRDCAGIAAPTSVSINIASSSCSRNINLTMPLISSQEVSPLCAAQLPNSTCNGGTLPGIQQYVYEATYTLPANCTDWKFSYTLCCRNSAVTNSSSASSYNLYVEANLNNVVVSCNSSPDFTVNPVPYICNGQPFSYNHGVVDVDGDSLSYTLIQPKNDATTNVPYAGGFSSTYPISTTPVNNFVFSPSTGQMTFTPNGTQIGLVAIRVDEYRNGVKIGSTIRDMQVIVINCGTNSTPSMANPINITGASYNTATSTFKACPGTPISFQFVSSDLDASQVLTLTSNVGTSIPAAIVTSTGTNPKTTTFTWTPTTANAGFYSVSFRAVDNACPLTASATKGFNIYVPSLKATISDTMVCTGTGKAFNLNATPTGTDGTETYAWTPNVGFTTSSTIRNPSVNISTPQTYVVSMIQGGCILRDTVRVKPYATLVASPDSSLCPFDPAIQLTSSFTKLMPVLSASPITYSWTPPSGLTPTATISNPSAKPATTTSYILSAGDALCTMIDTVRISVVPCPCYDTARIATPKVLTCTQLLDTLDGSMSTIGSSIQWIAYAGGNIVSGATTATPIVNQPGRYTLVITNLLNGCKDSTFVIVTRNNTIPNINAGVDTVLNCVRTNINLYATSSTPGVAYSWSNGASSATINVNAPNTYTVTVSNPLNGCTASDAVVVTQNILTPNINAGVDTVLNCVRTSLNLNAASSTSGVIYAWSNGATTATTNISAPNTYTVTVSNPLNGCTASDVVVVTQNIITPNINAGVDTVLNCVRTSLNLNATSSTTGVTFTWSNGATTSSINVSSPNTYTITVTNIYNQCTASDAVVVTQNIATPNINAGIDTVLNCLRTSLNLNATSSTTGVTYAWSNGTTTATTSISTPNTYTVTVTNPLNGCTASDGVVVTQDIAIPTINAGIDTVLNCVRTSLNLNATSSTSGVTYAWSNGATTATTNISSPNTYTVSVTNTYNRCTASDAVVVTQNITAPIANAGLDTILYCNRTTINWTATSNVAGVTYAWSNGVNTAANTTTVPNTYTVTVTNPLNGCTTSDAMVISQNITAPIANAGLDTILYCNRTTINWTATSNVAGVTYAWSNGVNTAANTTTVPNTYTVTVTSPLNGCTASDAMVISQNITAPTANAGVDTILYCNRTTINWAATSNVAGATYAWSNGVNTAANTTTVPNTYTVTVTNPLNGCTTSDAMVISQNITAPIANAGLDTILYCNRTTINWTATSNVAGATYAWSNGVNAAANTTTTPNTYTVTVTNPLNGCTASDAMVISQNITAPIANAGLDTILYCNRTTINWTATSNVAGATYAWSNGVNAAANTTTTPNTYTVTVTNPLNGCTASDAMVISQNITAPIANAGLDTILYCNRTTINWTATSNVAGATYAWSNGVNAAANTTTTPNTYTVTVTNPLNGCTASDAMVISQNITAPIVNAGIDTILNCTRTSLILSASAIPTGASFVWSNGITSASTSVSSPSTYTVTATHPVNGCTASDAVVVAQDVDVPIVNAGVDTILYCNRTTINWTATSNVAGATYAWSNGVNTAANTATTPNTYTVTVTNPLNGCTASDAMVISQNITAPIANAGVDTILYCNRTTINWTATSNVPGATYAWSNGVNIAANTTTTPNTYTVTVTNPLNGCTASDAMVITQDLSLPNINAGIDTVLNCVRTNLNLNATSTNVGATFVWSTGSSTASTNVTTPNTYTVTATHPLNGCTASDAVTVGLDTVKPNANAGTDTIINCTNPFITLHGAASTSGISIQWTGPSIISGGNTFTPNVNDAGTYTITITNLVSGCVNSDQVMVNSNFILPNADAGLLDSITCAKPQITLHGSSITSNVSYNWSGPGIISGGNTSAPVIAAAGLYTLTVTSLTNGCIKTDTVRVVQEITVPQVNAGVDTTLTCVRTNLDLMATSSTPSPITFTWSTGATTALTNVNSANSYTVTATNTINGCTASDVVVVSMDTVAPNINAGIDTVLNCVRTNINLNATSTSIGATFVWSTGSSTSNTNIALPNTYTVTATHPVNGCTASDAVLVGIDTIKPNADAGIDTVIDCTHPVISLLGSSTTYGVSVGWSGPGISSGVNTFSPLVNDAGGYSMTVTNIVSGCVSTDQVLVFANFILPNADAGLLDSITCAKPQITLHGSSITSNVSYNWSGPGIISGGNTSAPVIAAAGLYTLTVTSLTNGCIKTDTVRIMQEITVPQVNAGVDTTLTCVRTNLDLMATSSTPSPITFTWSTGATTAQTNVNSANSYTVTATNNINGCTATDVVVVSMDTVAPLLDAGADTILNCIRRNLSLQATSNVQGVVYQWSNGVNGILNPINTPNIYRVTATHPGNGCVSTDAVVVVIDTTTPDINAGLDTTIKCYRRNLQLNATSSVPSMNYLWSNGTVGSSNNVSVPQTYIVIGQNSVNGCINQDAVVVSIDTVAPNANAGPDKIVNCIKTSEMLNASSTTPNVTYQWSNGTTTSTNTVSQTIPYTVVVTNPINGCTASDVALLIPDTVSPGADAGLDKELTCSVTSVSFTASSPTPNVTYQWSNGIVGKNITVSTANTYVVTVTSLSNGCTSTDGVDAIQIAPPTITFDVRDNPCAEFAKGHIIPQIIGGKAPFTYSWNTGSSASALLGLHGGAYAVTITDANGCVSQTSFNVIEKVFELDVTADQTEIELGEEVHFNSSVTGGSGMEEITWTPSIYLNCSDCKNPTAGPMKSVDYTVVSIDTTGCKATDTISVHVTPNYQLYVPNAFSPNGDGANDVFEIFGNKKIWQYVEIKIFNRWGEMVFESHDHEFKWDGTARGSLLTPQVVVYELKIVYVDGYAPPVQKGSITIIR